MHNVLCTDTPMCITPQFNFMLDSYGNECISLYALKYINFGLGMNFLSIRWIYMHKIYIYMYFTKTWQMKLFIQCKEKRKESKKDFKTSVVPKIDWMVKETRISEVVIDRSGFGFKTKCLQKNQILLNDIAISYKV